MKLEIKGLSKTYKNGNKKALTDFTAEFTNGIYGILGPNGAGKSTLMNIITDNIAPDCGSITYDGKDIFKMGKDFRSSLGYMPQQQGLYDEFTANRFLWYMAALKGLTKKQAEARIEYVLNLVNLRDNAYKKLGSFSGGMKQRILIAQALLNDPEIIILDEPTAGLDPKERIRIRNFISGISLNKIILFTTHVVSDIESVAKEIVMLKQGRLVIKDRPQNIINNARNKVWELRIPSERLEEAEAKYNVSNILGEAEGLICIRVVGDTCPEEIDAKPVIPSLEDVYLYTFREEVKV